MGTLDIERVDLASLVRVMQEHFAAPPVGAVVGRTKLRDLVVEHLGCSELEGERLVDTMVTRGFVRLERAANGVEEWHFADAKTAL